MSGEIKEEIERFFKEKYICILKEEIKRLQAENEELKKYEYYYLDKFLELKQTLEEIRGYLQQFKKKKSNFYTLNDVLTDIAQKIENKINEVLDER